MVRNRIIALALLAALASIGFGSGWKPVAAGNEAVYSLPAQDGGPRSTWSAYQPADLFAAAPEQVNHLGAWNAYEQAYGHPVQR